MFSKFSILFVFALRFWMILNSVLVVVKIGYKNHVTSPQSFRLNVYIHVYQIESFQILDLPKMRSGSCVGSIGIFSYQIL